ncbi:MAG: DUF4350 domain-containing protein [Panacagrimonas sp.]
MNQRLVTLGLALLALLVLGGVMLGGRGAQAPPVSRPQSQDGGGAGLLGAYRWLQASGMRVERLRERYGALDSLNIPESGNLLVVHVPMVHPPRRGEIGTLQAWIARGNHLLLLQTRSQSIAWGGLAMSEMLEGAVGIVREEPEFEEGKDGQPRPVQDTVPECGIADVTHGTIAGPLRRLRPFPPNRNHPVLAGVGEIQVKARSTDNLSRVSAAPDRFIYPLLCDPQTRLPVLTVLRLGGGRVWASDYSELFVNDNLDRADNARLLANLVIHALGPGGAVIFDDMHQGDSVLYDPAAFFADPRLHGTLAFLLLIWLLWLLADGGRFSLAPAIAARPSGIDFVRAQAPFLARHLRRGEAAREVLRVFHDAVRKTLAQPRNGEPSWILLQSHARITPAHLLELRRLADQVDARRRVDLAALHNLTLTTQRELLSNKDPVNLV